MRIRHSILLVIVFVFTGSINTFSQIDNPYRDGIDGIMIQPDATETESAYTSPESNNIDEAALDRAIQEAFEKEDLKKLKDKGILTKAQMREELFKQHQEALNRELNEVYAVIDQNLGGFESTTNSITIACRDFQYPDGDEVTIYINNKPVVANIVLAREYASFTIKLEPGLNEIWFKALNQGFSGPNTAGFVILDENNVVLAANEWNLATGAKAIITIAKMDE